MLSVCVWVCFECCYYFYYCYYYCRFCSNGTSNNVNSWIAGMQLNQNWNFRNSFIFTEWYNVQHTLWFTCMVYECRIHTHTRGYWVLVFYVSSTYTFSQSVCVGCANVINIHDIHNEITRMCKQIYLKFVFFTCNMRRHLLEPACQRWKCEGWGSKLEWFVSIHIYLFIFSMYVIRVNTRIRGLGLFGQ